MILVFRKSESVFVGAIVLIALSVAGPAFAQEPSRDDVRRFMNQGEPRDDVARFKGRYSLVSQANRPISVYETCKGSGHLAAAPEWADVGSWYLQSESDLSFFQASAPGDVAPARLEFEADASGRIVALTMSGAMEGRFERIGDLMEGWEPEGDACYHPF